jgi:hypothetical protein
MENIPNYHKIYQITTKYTKLPQNIPTYYKIYQITTKYTKLPQNMTNVYKVYQIALKYPKNIPISSIARPSKKYPNLDFWIDNIPSGNPAP